MNIAVVGTGYVGLVTGTCFAETGNHVVCVDIDKEKVQKLKDGKVPIYEPHLDVLFERNIRQGRLVFTTDLKEAIDKAQIIFLALPTPPGEDGSADLKYVLGVADDLGKIITDYKVIVDKSTVPVGTAEKVRAAVAKHAKVPFDVVSNPEFLREGFAVDDFLKPDRVVVGTSSARAQKVMEDLYKPFVRQGNPIIFMDERSAELTKYAANAFLAAKITFMNEIANFCEAVGADVDKVRIGIGSDSRIGKRFLFPGIGYGGSCFPKDVQALAKSGQDAGYQFQIIDSVMKVNERQKTTLTDKVKAHYGEDLHGKHFALWGLAFKPDTDDIREAPALYMIDALIAAGATVTTFDPEAMDNVRKQIGDKVAYAKDEYEALQNADALIIATEWALFRTPDLSRVEKALKEKIIFDGRNLYDLDEMKELGYHYVSVGRQPVNAPIKMKA
ncbi:MAG: UDP-glucose/GDP-mannose dehydrogenase family protein [Flavobacteriales bacterium]|nr:UDP-glucose/GDP-mannose dehydrogenase family protein [Flavobacteriales bacterium]MBK7248863.1 UDP-glucose/GDP-mannose dehydrogenase family protein [Flavobacteriales bacterium]MBK9058895.1 UDP-glucose/GDP-mannose dehydrogenase family protein [Flavobacteriales bacterium]MBK9600106.1 UDP-glucose/GDP-mannose dehydrogenase family protein [Flavobacteriales bacterium]QQS74104.1 MAG: UDP-glucose/GDP-mannose dehydrogenase family protein [Flavobacteriales bacterium]